MSPGLRPGDTEMQFRLYNTTDGKATAFTGVRRRSRLRQSRRHGSRRGNRRQSHLLRSRRDVLRRVGCRRKDGCWVWARWGAADAGHCRPWADGAHWVWGDGAETAGEAAAPHRLPSVGGAAQSRHVWVDAGDADGGVWADAAPRRWDNTPPAG